MREESLALTVIDSHTGGMPTRLITGGLPPLQGTSVSEKAAYFTRHFDWVRTGLFREPRGLLRGVGAVLTETSDPKARMGLFFLDSDYTCIPMCGHGFIGVVTSLIHGGIIPAEKPFTEITLETPAGLVSAKAEMHDGEAASVTIRNVPAFWYQSCSLDLEGIGQVDAEVAVCGETYAVLQAEQLDLAVNPESAVRISRIASMIKQEINRKLSLDLPGRPGSRIDAVRFCAPPARSGGILSIRNAVVFAPGDRGIDRSPCGTGSSAHTALLVRNGQADIGEPVLHESIIGSVFQCRAVETVLYGKFNAVIPEITGSAYIMGCGTMVLPSNDPFRNGFFL